MTTASPPEGGTTRRKLLTGMGAAAAGAGILAVAGTQTANATVSNGRYFSNGPFRRVDTRQQGGRISSGQTRTYGIFFLNFVTLACNVTVVNTSGAGYLALYSADLANRPNPYASVNWYGSGQTVGNFAVFDEGNAGFNVYCGGNGSTHFIIDSIGFFYNSGAEAEQAPLPRR
jgi:hypothetical protein